jgi:hypothetical protein
MTEYDQWFASVTGSAPHPWQRQLADDGSCRDRLIRIPTGFGKTAGAVLPWLWHRVVQGRKDWSTWRDRPPRSRRWGSRFYLWASLGLADRKTSPCRICHDDVDTDGSGVPRSIGRARPCRCRYCVLALQLSDVAKSEGGRGWVERTPSGWLARSGDER